jgi:four helix bundle protein
MSKIQKFEDLICWQKARMLVNDVYILTSVDIFKKDFALKEQIRRAAISVVLNIAEGFARKSHKEFIRFLFMSHGSVAEVQAALYLALDLNYLSPEKFQEIYNNCTEISKIISGLIKSLN